MIQQARLNPQISKTFTAALIRTHLGGFVNVSRYLDLIVVRDGGVSPQVSVGVLLRLLDLLRNVNDSRTSTLIGNFQLFSGSKSLVGGKSTRCNLNGHKSAPLRGVSLVTSVPRTPDLQTRAPGATDTQRFSDLRRLYT